MNDEIPPEFLVSNKLNKRIFHFCATMTKRLVYIKYVWPMEIICLCFLEVAFYDSDNQTIRWLDNTGIDLYHIGIVAHTSIAITNRNVCVAYKNTCSFRLSLFVFGMITALWEPCTAYCNDCSKIAIWILLWCDRQSQGDANPSHWVVSFHSSSTRRMPPPITLSNLSINFIVLLNASRKRSNYEQLFQI